MSLLDDMAAALRDGAIPFALGYEWDVRGAEAWRECTDPRPLLRVLAYVDRVTAVRAACACARTALVRVPAGEERPLRAIETAEAWCRGEATVEECRAAAAYAGAAYAAAAYAAADAYAAAAYAAAAYAADVGASSRTRALRALADVVRAVAPTPPSAIALVAAVRARAA